MRDSILLSISEQLHLQGADMSVRLFEQAHLSPLCRGRMKWRCALQKLPLVSHGAYQQRMPQTESCTYRLSYVLYWKDSEFNLHVISPALWRATSVFSWPNPYILNSNLHWISFHGRDVMKRIKNSLSVTCNDSESAWSPAAQSTGIAHCLFCFLKRNNIQYG